MVTETVKRIGEIALSPGNVIPHTWYQHLRHKDGTKAQVHAILILSDIVYWYRPTEVRSERTNKITGYKKKFAYHKLQRSYSDYAEFFGLTIKQARNAIDYLIENGLVEKEVAEKFATNKGTTLGNVMFLEPIPEAIRKINDPIQDGVADVPSALEGRPSAPGDIASALEGRHTLTSTLTSTEELIYCATCDENEVDEQGKECKECRKEESRLRNQFATRVIEKWNLLFKEIPPVITKENTTIRIGKTIQVRSGNGKMTKTESRIRDRLRELYDDLEFRERWEEALDKTVNEPGLLIASYFDFDFWLQAKAGNSKNGKPVYKKCLDGFYRDLTKKNVATNVPAFNQPILHVPGNPGF